MKRILTLAVVVLIGSFQLRSQDIHFTLFDMVPVMFNPAETGNFYGSYRIAGIYRDQYLPVIGFADQFKTPGLTVDAPIIKGFRDQDWVGVGGMMFGDRSGELGLANTAFKVSAAYHLGLNKKGTTVLTLGYQTGSVARRIKQDGLAKLRLENPDDQRLMGVTELESSFLDHVVGINFKSQSKSKSVFQLGFAAHNIGSPDISLLGAGGGQDTNNNPFDSQLKYVAMGSYRFLTSSRLALKPALFAQFLGKAREISAQFGAEYLLNPEKNLVLRAGIGYRVGDALQLIVGMKFNDALQVALAYDANISRLSPASNGVGGFELSAVYIGKIYKRPDPDPILFCPRF